VARALDDRAVCCAPFEHVADALDVERPQEGNRAGRDVQIGEQLHASADVAPSRARPRTSRRWQTRGNILVDENSCEKALGWLDKRAAQQLLSLYTVCPGHRGGCLPIFVLAGFFLLALGSGRACAVAAGGHGGGHMGGFHGGGFHGGGRVGAAFPRGGFGIGHFAGRHFGGRRFAHGRHALGGFVYGDPFYDWYGYDQDYEYPAGYGAPRRYRPSGYCDVSHTYPQYCVWKDGP
jgi:hypothetical protein